MKVVQTPLKNLYFGQLIKNTVKNLYNWSNWYFEGDLGTFQLHAGGQTCNLKWIQVASAPRWILMVQNTSLTSFTSFLFEVFA